MGTRRTCFQMLSARWHAPCNSPTSPVDSVLGAHQSQGVKSFPCAETRLCRPRMCFVQSSGSVRCCRRAWFTEPLWETFAGKRITSGQLVEVDPDRLESVSPEILTRLQKGPDQVHSTPVQLHWHAHQQALVIKFPRDANSAQLCRACNNSQLDYQPEFSWQALRLRDSACMQCFQLCCENILSVLNHSSACCAR